MDYATTLHVGLHLDKDKIAASKNQSEHCIARYVFVQWNDGGFPGISD